MLPLLFFGVAFLLGAVVSHFFQDILKWGKIIFDVLCDRIPGVRKAWTYVRRVPGAVKQFVRYMKNGNIYTSEDENGKEISDEELEEMYRNGDLSKEEYEACKSERATRVAQMER